MIKIATFIQPQKKIKRKILHFKKKVKKNFGKQPYLSHPPHSTLFTLNVSEKILKEKKILKNLIIMANYKNNLTILKTDIFKKDPITGGKTLYFKIKKTPFLQILQLMLLKKFLKFSIKKRQKKFKFNWMMKNYVKYGYPFIGKKWIPHFTVASLINIKNEKIFIKNFLKTKIKLSELVKKIAVYKINGDKHIYLWSINIKLKNEAKVD